MRTHAFRQLFILHKEHVKKISCELANLKPPSHYQGTGIEKSDIVAVFLKGLRFFAERLTLGYRCLIAAGTPHRATDVTVSC